MEDPEFSVLLTEVGGTRLEVVKALRAATGRSLWHSVQLLETLPVAVLAPVSYRHAREVVKELGRAGARAALRCSWCERTLPGGPAGAVDPGPCDDAFPSYRRAAEYPCPAVFADR